MENSHIFGETWLIERAFQDATCPTSVQRLSANVPSLADFFTVIVSTIKF